MAVFIPALIVLATVVAMEWVAWASHKYIMHGFGWGWHRDHHEPHDNLLEKNDLYAVVGAPHPHLRASEGERYRDSLRKLADEFGVASHLRFVDRYVDLPDLLQLLAASDIYVTPYLNEAQICSGTLAYAVGLGKPVVSTPYWHAQELLADDRGLLVPFSDPQAMAGAVGRLLSDFSLRRQTEARAFALGRTMTWSAVAQRYAMIIGDVANRPIPLQQADSHFEAKPQTSFSQAGSSDPLRADAPRP